MDNSDLMEATIKHTEACDELHVFIQKEHTANMALLEKENEARKAYWGEWQEKKITGEQYKEAMKEATFETKLEHEKAKTLRKLASNKKDARYERLCTIKKQINVH